MPRRAGIVTFVSCGVVIAALAAATPATAARKRPDLLVSSVTTSATSVVRAHRITVRETTKNSGSTRAHRSRTQVLLSKDAHRSRGDKILATRKVRALKAHSHITAKITVTIPARTAPGSYRLVVCADATKAVTEKHEGNNCRASRAITVTVPFSVPKFPVAAHPLRAHVTVDDARAVSAPVSHSAATVLTTTGADGTKFRLSIPKDALAGDETITMTPITSITGVPGASGLAGAVRLEPDGLQLLDTATLTITPKKAIPVAQQTGISATDAGEDFHLYPLGMGRTITLSTTHFSDLGVSANTAAQQQAVADSMPVRTQAQYEQLAQQINQDARERALDGKDPGDWLAKTGQLWVGYDRDVVKPLEAKAETDDTWAAAAISQGLSLARQIELLGMAGKEPYKTVHDSILAANELIFRNAVDQSYDRCMNGHDLSEISRLVSYAHMAALVGAGGEAIFDKAQTCSRMELSLHTVATDTLPGGSLAYSFTVDVPDLAFNDFVLSGPAGSTNLTYDSWSIYDDPGRYPQFTTDGTTYVDSPTEVWGLGLTYDIRERKLESGQIIREVPPPSLLLALDPGQSREKVTGHWSDGDRDSFTTEWDDMWRIGHKDEGGMSTYPHSSYKIGNWEPQETGSATLGTKTYNRVFTDPLRGDTWQETTTLTITHAPES